MRPPFPHTVDAPVRRLARRSVVQRAIYALYHHPVRHLSAYAITGVLFRHHADTVATPYYPRRLYPVVPTRSFASQVRRCAITHAHNPCACSSSVRPSIRHSFRSPRSVPRVPFPRSVPACSRSIHAQERRTCPLRLLPILHAPHTRNALVRPSTRPYAFSRGVPRPLLHPP